MKLDCFFKLVGIHIAAFVLGTILFVSLFHFSIFSQVILFYKGLILLPLACLATSAILFFLKKTSLDSILTYRDIILSFVILFSFNLLFFTHIPVTADRSVSVFLLGYIESQGENSVTEEEAADFFVKRYVKDFGAVQRRFDEQIASGNITRDSKGYKLTPRGRAFIKFCDFTADIFSLDKRYIHPN